MPTGAPDYFKQMLLYGLFEDVATPLACDEQGRLIFIPEQVSPFDKSGTIVVHEDFSCGLVAFDTETLKTGASVSIATTESISAGTSVELHPGATAGAKAGLLWYMYPTLLNKLGVEFRVRWGLSIDYLLVKLDIYDGTDHLRAQLKYDHDASKWYVYDRTAGDFVEILDVIGYAADAHSFFRFKIVIDIAAQSYLRFRHPGGEVDISQYLLHSATWPSDEASEVRITAFGDGANNGWLYLDDVIITQDES